MSTIAKNAGMRSLNDSSQLPPDRQAQQKTTHTVRTAGEDVVMQCISSSAS